MTQQIDPIQIKGLSSKSVDKLNNLANIKNIGTNLELTDEGTLNAVGGGGGGGGGGGDVALYSALGQNTNGALTQKASTDLLVHAKPDGVNNLIENNKITTSYLPDSILGQVVYGGGFVPTTGVATLTVNAKERLDVATPTIILTNDTSVPTGYEANEGIYYIATANGSFASISFETGDWLISTGTAWTKVDNTDAVTGVKGANEVNYKLGNVSLSAQNVGAVSSNDAVSTQSITPFVTTSMIADGAVTSAKIDLTTSAFQFQPGNYSFGEFYGAGRIRASTNPEINRVQTWMSLTKTIASNATITFAPNEAYGVEVFGGSGVLYSEGSNTSAGIESISVGPEDSFKGGVSIYINFKKSVLDLYSYRNQSATVKLSGTMTIS